MWGLALILVYPLLSIVLSELEEGLRLRGIPLARICKVLRQQTLPVLFLVSFVRNVLLVEAHTPIVRIVTTLFWIAIAQPILVLLGLLFTTRPKQFSWQVRFPALFFQVIRAIVISSILAYVLGDVWNFDLSQMASALGVGSLVIALALQNTLSNLVSGFLLLFEGPFKVGDWLKVADLEGEVIDFNWRAVRLRVKDGSAVIVPNSTLGRETIHNYTLLDPIREVTVPFEFCANHSPNQVRFILETAAMSTEGVLHAPPSQALVTGYSGNGIQYTVSLFISDFAAEDEVRSRFLTRAYYTIRRHRLSPPLPLRPPETPSAVQLDISREEAIDVLQSLPSFRFVETEMLNFLAERAVLEEYGIGERIIEFQVQDKGFYIILQGSVRILVPDADGREEEVAHSTVGEFFGELTLFPGEVSPVAVEAIQDVRVLTVADDALCKVVELCPRFAVELNGFIEERLRSLHLSRRCVV